jgi:kumamolisin
MPELVELAGSRRLHHLGAPVGAPDPATPVTIGLYLKDPSEPVHKPGSADDFAALDRPMTRAQLADGRAAQFAEPARRALQFAERAGLEVAEIDLAKRRIRLRGPIGRMAAAFVTRLVTYEVGALRYRSHADPLQMPQDLAPWICGVLGLDTRPQLRRHSRLPRQPRPFALDVPVAAANGGFWPADVARLYGIAAPSRGAGQCIAIIAPRGGYLADDLRLAAVQMGFAPPEVVEVNVDNGRNRFSGGGEADQELALDLQVAAAASPAARLAVYFTDDSEQGLADAVLAAVHDQTHAPSVISISWGVAERSWTEFPLKIFNGALADAVQLGVIVTAAAGDMLATDAVDDDQVHVSYPASSPYVLSCGGTRFTLAANTASISDEIVWKEGDLGTGGGVSDLFAVPDYQQAAGVPPSVSTGKPGRGVPDVAGSAAFANGYRVFVNRRQIVQAGTSAVAPLWAGLIALVNAERGSNVRRMHPALYGDPACCRGILQGDNKAGPLGYSAGPGWNPCTGLGVPIGASILSKMTAVA